MISRWKKEFLENSAAAFETPKMDDAASCETEGQLSTQDRRSGDATGFTFHSVSLGRNKASFASALAITNVCKAGIQAIGDSDTRKRLISP